MQIEEVPTHIDYLVGRVDTIEENVTNITERVGRALRDIDSLRFGMQLLESKFEVFKDAMTVEVIAKVVALYKNYEDNKELTGMTEEEFARQIRELLFRPEELPF